MPPALALAKQGPVPSTVMKRSYYGATYLFDKIGGLLGITADLNACFPERCKQILLIVYFLILEDHNAMFRIPKWNRTRSHPYGSCIPSQRSSNLFALVTEEVKNRFFNLQAKRRTENEYWTFDTTSISSYSDALKQVKYGINKDYYPLAQINLALSFGEESGLPIYYGKLVGNVSDVKTVKHLLADLGNLGFSRRKLVMDRGFYSKENIDVLYQNHLKFLMATKVSLKHVQEELEKVRDSIRTLANYNASYQLYSHTATIDWEYSQKRPYKGDVIEGKRRMCLHLYFSGEKAMEYENRFNALLDKIEAELVSGNRKAEHEKQYAKYFEITTTPKRGTKVTPK